MVQPQRHASEALRALRHAHLEVETPFPRTFASTGRTCHGGGTGVGQAFSPRPLAPETGGWGAIFWGLDGLVIVANASVPAPPPRTGEALGRSGLRRRESA
jgi:hypothetical protein